LTDFLGQEEDTMTEQRPAEEEVDGGDIASGFGDSEVHGEVSDEKAQHMLHDRPDAEAGAPEKE